MQMFHDHSRQASENEGTDLFVPKKAWVIHINYLVQRLGF